MSILGSQIAPPAYAYSQLVAWEWNPTTDELRWTSRQTEIYDYSESEINSSAAWLAIVHPDDRMRVRLAMKWALESTPTFREHFRVFTKDRKTLWILGYGQLVQLPDQSVRVSGMNIEVTDWVEKLAASEAKFSATFEQAAVGIAHIDLDGAWLSVNSRCCEILGYSKEELLKLTVSQLTHRADLDSDRELIQELLSGDRSNYSIEKRYHTKSKLLVWANLTVSLVRKSDGRPDYFIAVIEDIAPRMRVKAQRDEMIEMLEQRVIERTTALEKLSMTDALTDVANRRRLDEQMGLEWDRAVRSKKPLSLLIIDIDHFKELNDTLGHGTADSALVAFAGELKQIARRPGDLCARYGGDEFVLVLPETDADGAMCIAKQVQMAADRLNLSNPGSPVSARMTVSQGVSTAWPAKKGNTSHLMLHADKALYDAKQAGRNRFSWTACSESPVEGE
ncbi:MAG: diguanylate cyclase [Terracidiphilus sp.]|jgi:diguanylate cyclase (GGDEF)-like protein/PAS domain S-box-containing protein